MKELYERYEKKLLSLSAAVMFFLIYEKYIATDVIDFKIQAVIAFLAYLLIASDIMIAAFTTLFKQRRMSEQFLMMVATFGAFGLGDLPEALAVMIFYKVGEIFEEYAQGKARNEITNLVKLKPTQVRVIKDDGTESVVKPRQVKIGDTIKVLAGEAIAIDGNLIEDTAAIDTSALTGESEPRLYTKGQSVPSGCINCGKVITLTVNTLSKNSSITRLLNLIEDATANKSKPENLIRRFAVWYTPIVVGAACLLSLAPMVIPNAQWGDWIERALVFLVVSCPCALVLSVPLSFFGGMGSISKIGVIVKGSIHIETLAKLKGIGFDKTGTLTHGKFKVVNTKIFERFDEKDLSVETVFSIAKALEQNSTHPIALSIVEHAKTLNTQDLTLTEVHEIAGLGIEAKLGEETVAIGKAKFIQSFDKDFTFGDTTADKTQIYVSRGNHVIGLIELFDELKEDAYEMISSLNHMGLKTCLITGDKKGVAIAIADKLKLSKVFYEQSPEDKLNNFKKFKESNTPSAFTGDGLNDAPVLSSADVGIAMGDIGSASAVEAADVVIMHDDLKAIPKTIDLARRTYHLAISNMYLVMLIKVGILLLGALGFANIWLAIFGDVGVLILAVLNAMRTMRFK